jgi:hypothetical protein
VAAGAARAAAAASSAATAASANGSSGGSGSSGSARAASGAGGKGRSEGGGKSGQEADPLAAAAGLLLPRPQNLGAKAQALAEKYPVHLLNQAGAPATGKVGAGR